MSDPLIISVGWDVRGWRSKEQATAILGIYTEEPKVRWLGISTLFQFKPGLKLGLDSLILPAVDNYTREIIKQSQIVTVAIDAPLAFPSEFINLISGKDATNIPGNSEIENPYAYRDCERWVKETCGKKPLSSAFDKLGNNATLAMSLSHGLREDGFALVPQDCPQADRAIIEVYPGIVKAGPRRVHRAITPIHQHIPSELQPGTDQYDAAICALLGAVYAGTEVQLGLPSLESIPTEFNVKEGWIYGFSADYIHQYQDLV